MNPVALLSMVLTSAGYIPVNLHPLIIHESFEDNLGGADVFEFHCGIVFEVSKSTITVSENALSIAYNFSTSASYLTTTFFGHFPRIDYGDTRTYQGSWAQE